MFGYSISVETRKINPIKIGYNHQGNRIRSYAAIPMRYGFFSVYLGFWVVTFYYFKQE
jgi:hypothetical protein